MREVVLAGAVRTAVGKLGGALSGTPAAELGSIVIREAVKRAGIDPEHVDQVLMGCVIQAGLGQNAARQASVKAGLPVSVPAQTLNLVCGSGLNSVNMAAALIRSGDADVIVAGGMENMSTAPYVLSKARFGYRMGNDVLIDSMINDGLFDAFNQYHMGMTAENVAERYSITREMQDEFSAWSQQKAEQAMKNNRFSEEIVPVPVKAKKETVIFERDEYPRSGVTAESLGKLRPAFKSDGTVTAGNSSGINDGAAAVVVMSAQRAEELGIKPMAWLTAGAVAGLEPEIMGMGPLYSTRKVLEKTGISLNDIDLIEANEAFAAQAVAVGQELGWDSARVNVNGGAIALGHPVGASGCRILVTLLHEMRRRDSKCGLATLCVGGGMGVSTIIERN